MNADTDLYEWLGEVSNDPPAFVMGAFPWGEPGTQLEDDTGPERWQLDVLNLIKSYLEAGGDPAVAVQLALQIAVASGHGVGKSALVSWILLWAISTMPHTRGDVTANTETQLKSKTWAELGKWYGLFVAKHKFKLTATALFHPEHERTWRIDMIPWSERNTEAFAGMHNKGRRIIRVFDEASAIPDQIWEVSEGTLTDADTQIIWCVFGNPTRNSGRFKECFAGGQFASMWQTQQVDSREVSFTNKADIARKIEAYGEDSDYVRIRILGQFPRRGEMEFFDASEVDAAMQREASTDIFAAVAVGVDVARYGGNNSVIAFRKGRDARTAPWQRYNGLGTVDLAKKVFAAHESYRSDGIFIDGGGVGGGVVDNCRALHLYVWDIQFGSKPDGNNQPWGIPNEQYANKRAEMYGRARAWLKTGAIPNDPELRQQMLALTYTFNNKDQIILERKEDMMKRGVPSPDDLDALVLTFAHPLASHVAAGAIDGRPSTPLVQHEYDPLEALAKELAA